mmetsp:Transcript_43534/g.137715  ORF Transcript_43534/g.137715 Transcript_43534/m.137715 type:complete len:204 (+) Transcript_43534:52-663(+)
MPPSSPPNSNSKGSYAAARVSSFAAPNLHRRRPQTTKLVSVALADLCNAKSNITLKASGTTWGTKWPVRITVANLRFRASRMWPITFEAEGQGTFSAVAKSWEPSQDMFKSALRLPMWLQTDPSRTPLYRNTSLPMPSKAPMTGAEGRVKSGASASATGPVSSAFCHVELPACKAAFTSGVFKYPPKLSVMVSNPAASVIPKS